MSSSAKAVQLLRTLGYTWQPQREVWEKSAGFPYAEVSAAPKGWYRRTQKNGKSWDGYVCVGLDGPAHFDLSLKPIRWRPTEAYPTTLVAADIVKELCCRDEA